MKNEKNEITAMFFLSYVQYMVCFIRLITQKEYLGQKIIYMFLRHWMSPSMPQHKNILLNFQYLH